MACDDRKALMSATTYTPFRRRLLAWKVPLRTFPRGPGKGVDVDFELV